MATTGRPGIGRLDLVVVVACLGALAAMAVPRQQEMSAAARRAEVTALANGVRSAAQFGHSLWQARGGPATLDVARGRVAIAHGYPAAGDLALLMEAPEGMAFRRDSGHWQHRDRASGRSCGVSYAPPASPGADPVITLHVSNC